MRIYRNINKTNERVVRHSLEMLSAPEITYEDYRNAFYEIGKELGHIIHDNMQDFPDGEVMFSFANEDADWLGRGVMEGGGKASAKISVFWNGRKEVYSDDYRKIEISPILKSYEEPIASCKVLVIVKSIISTSCVVKSQLNRLISSINPDKIWVIAPVMYKDAQSSLSSEFPVSVSRKFEFYTFAVDDEREGNTIIPGVGGQVYPRLGLGDSSAKNKYTPDMVIRRIKQIMQ